MARDGVSGKVQFSVRHVGATGNTDSVKNPTLIGAETSKGGPKLLLSSVLYMYDCGVVTHAFARADGVRLYSSLRGIFLGFSGGSTSLTGSLSIKTNCCVNVLIERDRTVIKAPKRASQLQKSDPCFYSSMW